LTYEAELHGVTTGALKEELAHFVACVRDRSRPPVVTVSEGVAALRVALAMIASAERGEEISVPLWPAAHDERQPSSSHR
jgi:predicted dehydrogenase